MSGKYFSIILWAIAALVCVMSSANAAEEDTAWKSEVELGMVVTTGNTETNTLNARAKAEAERDKWRHTGTAQVLKASSEDETTAERYFLSGQSDYKIDQRNYLFGLVSYEEDRFSGYEYRLSEVIGYGRRVIARPELKLDLEIGPGARQTKLEDEDRENVFTVRGAAKLAWKISDTSRFSEDFTLDAAEDVSIAKSVTSLSAKINSSLATKLSYTITHTSDVPDDIDNTDTEMAVTLVYVF